MTKGELVTATVKIGHAPWLFNEIAVYFHVQQKPGRERQPGTCVRHLEGIPQ